MKSCIIQPPYSRDLSLSDEYFNYKIDMLDRVDESVDIIVLPEYSDLPCATTTLEETLYYHNKYIDTLLEICVKTKSDEYYINMALAWLISFMLIKEYDKSVSLLESGVLDKWVHNKSIQKARESYRISENQKSYLKTLRR